MRSFTKRRSWVLIGLVPAACARQPLEDGDGGASHWMTETTAGGQPAGDLHLELEPSAIKQFHFGWEAVAGAEHYELLERTSTGQPFVPLAEDLVGESVTFQMPLYLRSRASYWLQACNGDDCTVPASASVMGSLAEAVGYVKASNTGEGDWFGWSVALSGDGHTLAVGARHEAGNATGIDGDEANDLAIQAGAVYVFVRDDVGQWSQQAYVKASNARLGDLFGGSISLSNDGNTLAVGARNESSGAAGIDGDESDESLQQAGAAYVYLRDAAGQWSQQAYVKASNPGEHDGFGASVVLSKDGDTLAVSATRESSNATGIDGDQTDDSLQGAGAVYVFVRDATQQWSQQAYVKASNPDMIDIFGSDLALSADGDTLAVGASSEEGGATGIDGDQADNSASSSGAVYVFVRDESERWLQQAYVKASNTGSGDNFGWSVALSSDGNTLAAGAPFEGSSATGIDGDQASGSLAWAGAVYVFVRDESERWSQQAYIKASNTGEDWFGLSVALSSDGNVLAAGASVEDGSSAGIDGDQDDELTTNAGAAYVFVRHESERWSQHAYVKASNPGNDDRFGQSVALSGDGRTLAVGANQEASSAAGIGGNQADDSAPEAGAVYLY